MYKVLVVKEVGYCEYHARIVFKGTLEECNDKASELYKSGVRGIRVEKEV